MSKKVYIDFELRYKEAVKNLDEMQKEYTKLETKVGKYEKQVEKAADTQNQMGGVLDKVTGGAVTKFKNLTSGVKSAIKGFKGLRVAIISTGIGALVIALGSLITMFKSSEEGQNRFAKIMTQISVVTNNLIDIFSDFGSVIFNVFKGDFGAAKDALKDVTEGVKNFGEETRKELEVAGELADKRAKADKVERGLIVERAEATRKYNELREKAAQRENFTSAERIEFLKEAGRVEEEITLKEIAAAKLRFEAKSAENKLSKSTKEDLDEEAQLKARLIELEASRLKKQKTLNAELVTNIREAKALEKAEELELANFKKQLRDAEAVSEEDKRALELLKIEEHYQALIDKAIENDIATTELEDALRLAKEEKQAGFDEADAKKQKEIDDKIKADADKRLAEEQKIEEQRIALREKTFSNAVQLAGAESRLGKTLLLAKQLILAKEFILDAKKQIMAAKSAVNTAVINAAEASTETTGSVAKGANAAPPPFNIPFILSAIATGASVMSAVRGAVKATKKAASSSGAGGGASLTNVPAPSISTPTGTESQPPSFSTVGASGVNQLADVLGGGQQPVRAFVVSSEVSTAQQLDRNIVQSASIG
tara:strand:+ start:127 stop:1923 length:1797 start_codon:yes stop_codon:yes gene_type:complete